LGKYNWEEIKSQIEIGKYTIREIAEKYKPEGTSLKSAYDYIRKKKKDEGWEKNKDNEKYTKKVKSKLMENESDREAELREEYNTMINNIRRGTYKTLMSERNTDRLRQFKLAIKTIQECRKEQWEVNQIQEVAEKVEQEIDHGLKEEGLQIEVVEARDDKVDNAQQAEGSVGQQGKV